MVALELQVLVLNRLWQPVNTCTARRAVCLVSLGHAHIVHRDDENNYSMHDADRGSAFRGKRRLATRVGG